MNIIILAAGEEYLDTKDDNYPLCLTEIRGRSLLQHISEQIDFQKNDVTFIFQNKHTKKYHLNSIVELLSDNKARVISVPENTAGAAATALLAAVKLEQSQPLLIISSNQLTDVSYQDFSDKMQNKCYEAGTIIFDGIHPRYSFVSIDENGYVNEASEKKPISRNATAGVFWFKNTELFINAVKNMIRNDARVDNKFYICPSLNEVILCGGNVGVYKIDRSQYHPLKNVHHVEEFIDEKR